MANNICTERMDAQVNMHANYKWANDLYDIDNVLIIIFLN